ncbi:hypothetical protein AGMMS50229_04120 [Campylobacterota bacterium]|nr:hypothetical protein AGMMS50229_04120 [Campylobacterota bacterium]
MLKKFSTPIAFGVFLIITISGVLMFFHIKTAGLVALHEWLGLAFVLSIGLHLLNHKKPTVSYITRPVALGTVAVIVLLSAGFYLLVPEKAGGSSAKMIVKQTINAPISVSAGLFGISSDEAAARLLASGIVIESQNDTIAIIAERQGVSFDTILKAFAQAKTN